jgi:hypothetical protein
VPLTTVPREVPNDSIKTKKCFNESSSTILPICNCSNLLQFCIIWVKGIGDFDPRKKS